MISGHVGGRAGGAESEWRLYCRNIETAEFGSSRSCTRNKLRQHDEVTHDEELTRGIACEGAYTPLDNTQHLTT